MKRFLLFLCCIPVAFVQSQITIGETDMPNPGDEFLLSVGDPFTYQVNLNETGPDHLWNYADLIPLKQKSKKYELSLLVSPLYALLGPLSMATKIADSIDVGPDKAYDVYHIYEQDELLFNVFQLTGRGLTYNGLTVPTSYNDKDEIYFFPLEFGNHDTSTFAINSSVPNFATVTTTGQRYTQVDGWGKLTTPYGTFDVLRVRSVVDQIDSVYVEPLESSFINYYRTFEIKFLAQGIRYPILEFKGNLFGNIYDLKEINYLDFPRNFAELYKPVVDFTANATQTSVGVPVTFTNLTNHWPQNQYEWTVIPSQITWLNNTSAFSRNPVVSFNSPGLYHIRLKATNPFGSDEQTKNYYINVDFNLGMEDTQQPIIQVYPNPAGNMIQFSVHLGIPSDLVIDLTDMQGRTAATKTWKGNSGANLISFDIEDLAPGIYSYRVTGNGSLLEGKFVKE